jgi:para-aminobenzoate synthetase
VHDGGGGPTHLGYLGYELLGSGPGVPSRHRAATPDAVLLFADRGLVLDHETGRTYLLALTTPREHCNLAWLDEATRRLAIDNVLPPLAPPSRAEPPPVTPRHTDEHYLELIDECRRRILMGESYEICLTNMIVVDCEVDPWQTYRRLRSANPAPFASFLRLGPHLTVLSSSPERFLRVGRDGTVESRPIKGTRARGSSPSTDALAALELATSLKERAENLMIVDLVRNDLGHTARTGSVEVPTLCEIDTYETVHQMVSTVRAALQAELGPGECLRHAFPGGSMTGAPKRRTMEIIDELEDGARGVYSGAIGYFSLGGAADLSITIRTIVINDRRVTVGVGGAITALSDP